MEEGIIQEKEQRDRRHAELGGLEEIDILTASPDEPQPSPSSSTSQSELSYGTGWMSRLARPWKDERRRRQDAEARIEREIEAAIADDQCRTIEELDRAVAMASQDERRWEEHREHLEQATEAQAASEAVAMTQLQDEMDELFDQLLQSDGGMPGVAGAAGEGNGVIEATEGAELVQSSPEEMVAVPEAEAEVSFAFYLLQGSGPSAGGRRAQGQGWLQVNTWQLGASLTLSAAFEAAWCEGCGDMDNERRVHQPKHGAQ